MSSSHIFGSCQSSQNSVMVWQSLAMSFFPRFSVITISHILKKKALGRNPFEILSLTIPGEKKSLPYW